MKAEKDKLIFKIVIFKCIYTILFGLVSSVQAQSFDEQKEPNETNIAIESWHKVPRIETKQYETEGEELLIEAETSINFRPKVDIEVRNTQVQLLPTRNEKVIVQVIYTAVSEHINDLKLLKNAMQSSLLKTEGDNISIKLDFYKTMNTLITPEKRKIVIKLNDGEKIKLSEFSIKEIKIFLPSNLDLTVEANHTEVKQEFSMHGNLVFKGYDSQLKAKRIDGGFNADAKYSKIELPSCYDANLKLYESKVELGNTKQLKVDSKYSHIKIGQATDIKFIGYEDELKVTTCTTAKFDGKYCTIEMENSKSIIGNFYEGSLQIDKTKLVKLKAKYFELDIDELISLKMLEGYENELNIIKADTVISIDGKYNDVDIELLNSLLQLNGYEDDIKIHKLDENFMQINVDGKYIDIELNIPTSVAYKFYGNIQYPGMNINKDNYKVVLHDSNSSLLKFEYYKGKTNSGKQINIEGYEMDVSINDL